MVGVIDGLRDDPFDVVLVAVRVGVLDFGCVLEGVTDRDGVRDFPSRRGP